MRSLGIVALALVASLNSASAIRIITGDESAALFGSPIRELHPHHDLDHDHHDHDETKSLSGIYISSGTFHPVIKVTKIDKGPSFWDWLTVDNPIRQAWGNDRQRQNEEVKRPIRIETPAWFAPYAVMGPSSLPIGSDSASEDRMVEAMLAGESIDQIMHNPPHPPSPGSSNAILDHDIRTGRIGLYSPGRGRVAMHGHGDANGHGQGRCFFGRLRQAISSLRPLEAFFIAFTFGAGLGSLLRILWLFSILIKRSHSYMNEEGTVVSGGANRRARRSSDTSRSLRRVVAEEQREDLPTYEVAMKGEM